MTEDVYLWLLPIAATVIVLAIANDLTDETTHGDYGAIGQGLGNAIVWLVASVVILLIWLVYVLWWGVWK